MSHGSTKSQTPNEVAIAKVLAVLDDVMDEKRHDKALAIVSKVLGAASKDPALLHCRGALYVLQASELPSWKPAFAARRKKGFQTAVKDFDKAIKLSPDYADAYLNRGLAYYQLADRKSADANFTRALEIGLEPVLALQAHSHRGADGDIATVNRMRRTRGIGNDWRPLTPQLRTLRGVVPAADTPKAKTHAVAKKKSAPVVDVSPETTVATFEQLTARVLETDNVASLRMLHREIETLELLESGDKAALRRRIDKCIKQLRAYAKELSGKAAIAVENILDSATSS